MAQEEALAQTLTSILELDHGSVHVAAHGGSGFSATLKVTGMLDGEKKEFFVKKGLGEEAKIMFAGLFIYDSACSCFKISSLSMVPAFI